MELYSCLGALRRTHTCRETGNFKPSVTVCTLDYVQAYQEQTHVSCNRARHATWLKLILPSRLLGNGSVTDDRSRGNSQGFFKASYTDLS